MNFIFFAWIGVTFFGLELVVSKLIMKHSITNPWLFNITASFFFLIYTTQIALYFHAGFPKEWSSINSVILLNAVIFILNALVIYLIDISVLNPFGNLRTAFGVLLAAMLLGEILTPFQYILIGIMFTAGVFASMDERLSVKSFLKWPIFLVISDMAFSALIGIYMKQSIAHNGFWTTQLWMFLLSPIAMLLTFPFFRKDFKKLKPKNLYPIGIVSAIGLIGTLAVNQAFSKNVGITNAILAIPTAMILSFFFSVFAPKLLERHPLKVYLIRFGAAAVMITAALMLR